MKWNYLFKHWFGTLLIGPIISQIIAPFSDYYYHQVIGLLEVYPVSLIFGLFFSTPTYILYGFLYYYLARNNTNTTFAKPILILFSVIGVLITTSLIGGTMMPGVALSYSITSILSGLFFKLDFKEINNDNN